MKFASLTTAALALFAIPSTAALAGADPYIGEVTILAGNYCPPGSAIPTGQILPIRQYQALYSLLGSRYGGDGTNTFALPNLAPIKTVQGETLTYCISLAGAYPTRDVKSSKAPAKKE